MTAFARFAALLLACLAPVAGSAQTTAGDPLVPLEPVRPLTKQDLDQREALSLYGLACVHERNNRLVEAMRTFEDAQELDPQSAPILRSLIPLYLALDRGDDAAQACKRVLTLDPGDVETAFLYAKHLRGRNEHKESLAVLARAVEQPSLKDRPDLHAQLRFEQATLLEEIGSLDQAEAAYRKVTALLDNPAALLDVRPYSREQIDSQSAETWERLGRLLQRLKKAVPAVEAFRQAQKKDPERAPRLAFHLAGVLRGQGQPREALASLNEYLRTQPHGIEGYELKSALLQELNRGADVLRELDEASGRDPHNVALKLLLAREYRKARQPADAERIYQQLLRESPSPDVFKGFFELCKEDRLGGERALRQLDEAIKLAVEKDDKPGDTAAAANARAMLQVARDDAELVKRLLQAAHQQLVVGQGLGYQTRVLLAGLASRTRQLDIAERLYRSCLDRPGGLRGIEQEVYGGLLRVLMQSRKYEAVVELCKRGLEGPNKAEATNRVMFYIDLAHAQLHLQRQAEAIAAANEAVAIASDKDRLFCRRARIMILAECEKFSEAIAEGQSLMREYNQPGEVRDIRATLSSVYSLKRQFSKAIEQLLLILKDDPNDATANNDLGYIWADQNRNLDEAERLVRKALELDRQQRATGNAVGLDPDRDNAAYIDSLGWVLFRKGDLAGARRELEKAAALPGGDDDPVVYDHLGDVYFRQGETARALTSWKRALELFDAGVRRKTDVRYKEIQQKLKQHAP